MRAAELLLLCGEIIVADPDQSWPPDGCSVDIDRGEVHTESQFRYFETKLKNTKTHLQPYMPIKHSSTEQN